MKLGKERVWKSNYVSTSLQRHLRAEIAKLELEEAEARRQGNRSLANALAWKIQARIDRLKGKPYTPTGDNIIALQ